MLIWCFNAMCHVYVCVLLFQGVSVRMYRLLSVPIVTVMNGIIESKQGQDECCDSNDEWTVHGVSASLLDTNTGTNDLRVREVLSVPTSDNDGTSFGLAESLGTVLHDVIHSGMSD
jgi:hypothetical protein